MDKPTYHRPKIAHQELQIQLQIKKLDLNKELNFMHQTNSSQAEINF
jgi:hypothetical protein